ncbi:TadE/TadG family type IV pilus assembly protein [Agreia sp. COWG]|uniref:TadE/TadG family type IV pilus assembly protein n=1 Tax=Agreia sp. COWG TaxID=2773266 RepID=UPI001F48A4BB|nr:TadE/TadG family type IV pilus assembly protein [Agreia sp. COWG]
MCRRFAALGDDRGSAAVEFVLVGVLLTALTLAVIQLAFALHVKNTLLDAAAEGARYSALAGNGPADGALRTRQLITTAVGPDYATGVTAGYADYLGAPATQVTVLAPLPLAGPFGPARSLEVVGHASVESIAR